MPRASTARALMKKKEKQNRGIYRCDHRRQEAEIKLGFLLYIKRSLKSKA